MPRADVQRADALRPLELVRREREQVAAERARRRSTPGARLPRRRRANRQPSGFSRTTSPIVGDRLERADLVVRELDRDERRPLVDRAPRRASGSTRPYRSTGSSTISKPNFSRCASAWRTAWCSTALVTIRWPRALPAHAAPLSARFSASVPPLVITISRGLGADRRRRSARAPRRARRARAPPERVRRRRVAELAAEVRQHRLERLGPERRRGGVVEIDRHGPGIVVRAAPPPLAPRAVRRLAG